MDARLTVGAVAGPDAGFARRPPEAPLDMPKQPLSTARTKPVGERDGRWRFLVIASAGLTVSALATQAMWAGFAPGGVNVFEWTAVVLFALNFFWLSTASMNAVAGTISLLAAPKAPRQPATKHLSASRTALVIPIYNESAAKVIAGAEAIWDALREADSEEGFEIFLLSDTTDRDLALIEEAVVQDLLRRRPGEPFYYRRRRDNTHKKQGNIADFVTRWGARYDYMVVLDADSIVSPDGLLELVRRMDASPRTALIQTLPIIVGARTFSSRSQQLSLRVHGGLFGAGLSWWSGGAGNFWGHNAIIRIAPFARHASLPELPGKAPLGGPILSHDFVEAALLRRAGWRVEIAGDIEGSYEEAPPTLVDLAARDRRWAQGNIQQIQVMCARGFDWLSRVHIGVGVMGYMSGLLWLGVIVMGVFIAGWAKFFDSETTSIVTYPGAGTRLLLITALVLTSPKWLALILWAANRLPGWKREPRFLPAVLSETLLTAVMAPILMLNHASAIIATLLGRDAGWRPQIRERDGFAWGDLLRHYRQHMIFGISLLLVSFAISPGFMLQNMPIAAAMMFAPMITRALSGRARKGSMLWRLFATPEDLATPEIVRAAEKLSARGSAQVRRFAPARRSRSMQRFGLVVRRAMRRVRRAGDPTRRAAD